MNEERFKKNLKKHLPILLLKILQDLQKEGTIDIHYSKKMIPDENEEKLIEEGYVLKIKPSMCRPIKKLG